MKRYILYIGILIGVAACSKSVLKIEAGDLLFLAGKGSEMEGAISAATGEEGQINFTHVGIALGADSVIEATSEGDVRIAALRDFLAGAALINKRPAVAAFRLRDTAGVTLALRRARSCIGLPYDYAFRPENGKFYCSELVWESFRTAEGVPRFRARPMNFRAADGSLPLFWVKLFARTGDTIPEGVSGTNPAEMAREEQLTEIYRWY